MARSYDIRELVTLPRLDANGADALVTELLAHAKGKKLAAPVERARKALAEAQKGLKSAIAARLQTLPTADSARAKAADQAEDAAFSATFDWLTGFSKLPDSFEQGAVARRLMGAFFRDGLKFTQLPYKLEWAEADARLRAVTDDRSLEQAFTTLGGEVFLKNLRRAHKEYGEALGVTTPKQAEQGTVLVKEPLATLRGALRTYVLHVLAHQDDDGASTVDVAEGLLAPLAAWEAPTRNGKAVVTPDAPAAGDTTSPEA